MLLVGVPWGIWSAYTLMGGGGSRSVEFNAAAGWFVVLAMGYLGLHGVQGIAWSGVPALLTVEGLFGFVLIPAWRFAHGQDVIDASYIRAMNLALIGFVAFWIGSLLCMKKTTFQFVPRRLNTPERIEFMSLALLILGLIGGFILWKSGLSGYTADLGVRVASYGYLQWLTYMGNLLNTALVIAAIEMFGKKQSHGMIKFVFWSALLISVGGGMLSGMKSSAIYPLLNVIRDLRHYQRANASKRPAVAALSRGAGIPFYQCIQIQSECRLSSAVQHLRGDGSNFRAIVR